MRTFLTVIAATTLVFAASAASAQNSGGVKSAPGAVQIQGNTTINAVGKNVNTIAIGSGNTVETDIGAINNAQIKGNTTINAVGMDVNTIGIGSNNTAKTAIGSIGK